MTHRLNREFYTRDVLTLAPALLGTKLICLDAKGRPKEYIITETEAYKGTDDLACHASKGRTKRNDIMFHQGGLLYIYLIYGIHWMLNIVSGEAEEPQAVLIRSLKGIAGPGRLTKKLGIDKNFNKEDLTVSEKIWLEESGTTPQYTATTRIGVDYAGPQWKSKPWRFVMKDVDLL